MNSPHKKSQQKAKIQRAKSVFRFTSILPPEPGIYVFVNNVFLLQTKSNTRNSKNQIQVQRYLALPKSNSKSLNQVQRYLAFQSLAKIFLKISTTTNIQKYLRGRFIEKAYKCCVLRRRLLHRNGNFATPSPRIGTRQWVKTNFRRKTGHSRAVHESI